MSDYPEERLAIQTEQVVTRKPTSESLFQPMAGSINHLLKKNYSTTVFNANGSYKGGVGRARIDGFYRFKFDAQIIGAAIFNGGAGASGTTEADVLRFVAPGGIGSSIFSTTPKVSSAASNNVWIANGETVAGCTAPVLLSTPLNVNAGDVLMMKILQSMAGSPTDLQVEVYWLPRGGSV